MKTCSFAGHANISQKEETKLKIKNEIINLIENKEVSTFYNGGKSDFDWLCALCLAEVKIDYPFIKSYLILSYIPKEQDEYTNTILKIFDSTIYPNIENVPPRFAILKRNEWMIDNSDFLIAYVKHSWGGAAKTLEYAKKNKHIIINNIV